MKNLLQVIVGTKGQVTVVAQKRDAKGRFLKAQVIRPEQAHTVPQYLDPSWGAARDYAGRVLVQHAYSKDKAFQYVTVVNGVRARAAHFSNTGEAKAKADKGSVTLKELTR